MAEVKNFSPSGRWRVAALLVLAVLLHVLIIDWGKGAFNAAPVDAREPSSVSVVLRPLEPPKQPVSLPLATPTPTPVRPHKVRKVHKPAAPKPAPVLLAPPAASAMQMPQQTEQTPEPQTAGSSDNGSDATPEKTPPAPDAKEEAPAPSQGTHYQIDPPPSAELTYQGVAGKDNLTYYGTGVFTWKNDGDRYSFRGEAYVRFIVKIGLLDFTSSGDINEFGIAPELYTEKKANRPATNTHFNRARNVVSFSASTVTYPRVGGEQDRGSLIWQLAGIGRGDSSKFAPGAVIDLFVAGVRDGEVWRMQVVGLEEIRLVDGVAQAWHIVRQPRPGSYEQRLDIWLEPGRQWYPARLRFTETNGDYLELSLSDLKNSVN